MNGIIFVSHRETDKDIAKSLVDLIAASLELNEDRLRCTSVPRYQLPFGESIDQRLKKDLNSSDVLFALLTPESLLAPWVMFELGAAWAHGRMIVPILGPGLSEENLPGPLRGYPSIRIMDSSARIEMIAALDQIAKYLEVGRRTNKAQRDSLEHFVETFRSAWRESGQIFLPRQSQDDSRKELEKIIQTSESPGILYISAAGLHSMGPWLERIYSHPVEFRGICRNINGIFIKKIGGQLLTELERLRCMGHGVRSGLSSQLAIVKKITEKAKLPHKVAEWDGLPPFHGTLFQDWLTFAPYEIDENGEITAFTGQRIMTRKHNPPLFGDYEEMMKRGFA